MTAEDALRKVALLRRINTDNGAMAAEAETARRLQAALMTRYAIERKDVQAASPTTVSRLTWTYWDQLLEEFGLRLDQFGNRGSAAIGNKSRVYIRLDENRWWVEASSPGSRQITARSWGVESLRKYLKEHAPKSYTFFRR